MQLPLFKPEIDWEPPKISELPSWKGAGRVSVDVETKDPQLKTLGPGVRRDGYVVGISFAIEDGPSAYVPIRHAGGDNVESPEHALAYFRDQAKVFSGDICGAQLQYDLDYLAQEKIVFRSARWFRDCQIAEPLLDELQFSYSLENIAARRGLPGKDETLLLEIAKICGVDPKKDLWKLPARYVAGYAVQDAKLPLQLLRRQEREIDEQELWEVYNLESRLLPVLVKMRRRGVRVDFDKLEQVEKWALEEAQQCLDRVRVETLVQIAVEDVMKAAALAPALQAIGVKVPRTVESGQYSIDKDFLASLKHPVADALNRARKVAKLRTTFAASVRKHAVGDRIHCTFNQLRKTDDGTGEDKGARYGRLSCVDPNLQQQPSRDDFADMWRSIYIPDDPDSFWASNDYSQQEPRWLVHYAEDCHENPRILRFNCPSVVAAAEKYRNDPLTDNHTMMARIIYGLGDKEEPSYTQRFNAKIIFLGLCYGMGGAKLARSLGLPTKRIENRRGRMIEVAGDEAQAVLDLFNRRVPFVRQLAKLCEKKAARTGYIKTVSGRHCRFPAKNVDGSGGYDWIHKACNRLIQGSSGDQTKIAMVEADKAGFRLQLQVHDELDQTVERVEQAKELAVIMRECVTARVPFRVDTEVGPSWGEVKKVAQEESWEDK
jgi:DNA polymerase I-like protein with 3'-5' exonuclease and polymerase domains